MLLKMIDSTGLVKRQQNLADWLYIAETAR